jgi:arginase family enzyme
MIDIVKVPLSDKKTINTRLSPPFILGEMKYVWNNETDKPMDEYTVYDWEKWSSKDNRVIFLGGDHSITLSTFPKTKATQLVVLDSHFDLYGSIDHPFHGNWLKVLIERNLIDPHNITILGVRAWEKIEMAYANEKGIKYVLFDHFLPNLTEPTYLSIDIDVVDPAFAPGTGYMEPGGWSSRNLIDFVKTLRPNLMAMDIVEVDSTKDLNNMTSKLAAKVMKEFL